MGSAGVQRSLKFTKYLPNFDVHPVVLAAYEPGYISDASLMADLPMSLRIERVESRPLLARLRRGVGVLRRMPVPTSESAAMSVEGGNQFTRDLILKIYASSQFPDDKIGWAKRAFARACDLVHEENIDMIFSTAPPYSAHWLAARVSAKTKRPWVADCRDLWVDNPGYMAASWRAGLDRYAERRIFRSAAGVVTVTPTWADMFSRKLGRDACIAMIPNGYDEDDFSSPISLKSRDGNWRIAHVGSFYGHQSPLPFLSDIDKLLDRNSDIGQKLSIYFAGAIGSRFDSELALFEDRHPGVLQCTGYLPHRQAIEKMCQADALLLVVGGGNTGLGVLPGKIFEYLRSMTPVIFYGPGAGDAAEILRQHTKCLIIDDKDKLDCRLRKLLGAIKYNNFDFFNNADSGKFERRVLTEELASFLKRCMRKAHGGA